MSDVTAPLVPLLDTLAAPERDAVVPQFEKVARERDEYKKLAALLQEANEKLKRGLVGQSAERLPSDDAQLSLAILRLALGVKDDDEAKPPPDEEQTIPEHTRRKPVRKPIPDSFPRVTIELVPEEVKREGTEAFDRIGEDAREVLERRPASTVAVRLVYPKFVRKGRAQDAPTAVLVAEPAELPIPRGTAGPAMLADTLVRRWGPIISRSTASKGSTPREGLALSKSTLCTWHDQLRELASPLVDAMFTDAKSAPYLCVDATGVLVQAPERCKHGHFWVMVAPGKHVLYKFSQRHNSQAVDALLAGYA